MPQKWVSLVVVMCILGTLMFGPSRPQAVYAADGVVCAETYTVQANDWLSKIADRYFGDVLLYPAIVNATNQKQAEDDSFANIDNADLIEPGWKLCIVDAEAASDVAAGDLAGVMAADEAMAASDDAAMASDDNHREKPHWTYSGDTGPEAWGTLAEVYEACGTGLQQSPINLFSATEQDLVDIAFSYQPTNLNILNNGHTVQVNYEAGSSIEVDGVQYNLLQFHFHTPSEHTIDVQFAALEMHLVHADADGNLAVVGIMLNEGTENGSLMAVWDYLPITESLAETFDVTINAADLLPVDQQTYRYSGSLTTPPCSEGGSWFVMTTPIELSADQVAAFQSLFEFNNRPIQPLNDRDLVVDNS